MIKFCVIEGTAKAVSSPTVDFPDGLKTGVEEGKEVHGFTYKSEGKEADSFALLESKEDAIGFRRLFTEYAEAYHPSSVVAKFMAHHLIPLDYLENVERTYLEE